MTGILARRRATTSAAVLACLLLAWLCQMQRDRALPPPTSGQPVLTLRSGTLLRRLSVGYATVLADLYWMRTVQHYGGEKRRLGAATPALPSASTAPGATGTAQAQSAAARTAGGYALLHPLLDITTTLDPRYSIAYRFGAIFLAEPFPGGAGRPDLALALLERAVRENPTRWEYLQDAGFVHYWWRHDFAAAAAMFDRASQVPGAPWFLRSLAAHTLAEGGDRQSSRVLWQTIQASTEVAWLREDAERRLLQLDALDAVDHLQALVDAAPPTIVRGQGWAPLIRARIVPGTPLDPMRVPYVLRADGRVVLATASPLFPLPDEPERREVRP